MSNNNEDPEEYYKFENAKVDVFEMLVIYSTLAQKNPSEAESYLQKLFNDKEKLEQFLVEIQKIMKSTNLGLDTLAKSLLAKIAVSFATRGEKRDFESLRDVRKENTIIMTVENAIKYLESQESPQNAKQRPGGVKVRPSTSRRTRGVMRGSVGARAAGAGASG